MKAFFDSAAEVVEEFSKGISHRTSSEFYGVPVQMWQEVADDEGQRVEGEAGGAAERDTMARSSSLASQGSLCGRAERS